MGLFLYDVSTAFYERYRYCVVDLPKTSMWKADVVLEEILKCLKSKTSPPDLLIGMDSRFAMPVLRMVPTWCSDFIVRVYPPLPTPADMAKGC